jgi:hypothetical protein
MTEDPPAPAPRSGAVPTPPRSAATASGSLSYPLGLLFGLGALACVAWLGGVLLDLWMLPASLEPTWLRGGIHVVVVLVVPAFILLVVRSPHLPALHHGRAFFTVEGCLLVLVALPALVPYTTPTDLASLPLRVPTLSLGVALAAVDPFVSVRWRRRREVDSSIAMVASAGFGAVVLATALGLLVLTTKSFECTGGRLACGGVQGVTFSGLCGSALSCVLAGWFGAWLGYAVGARIARSELWR